MTNRPKNTHDQSDSNRLGLPGSRPPVVASGTSEPEPYRSAILHLFDGLGAAGYLILVAASGKEICVSFTRTFVRVLFALRDALKADADAGLPAEVRGWRSAKRLAKAIADQHRYLIPVKPSTITHDVWAINRAVREAAEEQGLLAENPDSFKIIRTKTNWGYKLGLPNLEIIQGPDSTM